MFGRVKAEVAFAKAYVGYKRGTATEEQRNEAWSDLVRVTERPCRCGSMNCTECTARKA